MHPKGWKRAKFGDIAVLEYGRSLPARHRTSGSVPVCGSSGIIGHHTTSLVEGPGVVLGRKGSVGSVTWIDRDFWPIDTTYYVLQKGSTNLHWIYYALQTLKLQRLNEATGIPGLNRNTVANLTIHVPPLKEQCQISKVLASVDDVIEKNIEIIRQIQFVKRGLMQRLLTRDLRTQDSQLLQAKRRSTIHNTETNIRLSEFAAPRTEKVIPSAVDECPYVSLEHLVKGQPKVLGYFQSGNAKSAKTTFKKGDVLFGKLRPNLRKSAPAPFDGLCSTDILPLYGINGLDSSFLLQLTHWSKFQQHAISTASGTKMPRTSWKHLGEFEFWLPSLEEQHEIVAVLSSIDAVVELTYGVSEHLKCMKGGLMARLFSGDVRVSSKESFCD